MPRITAIKVNGMSFPFRDDPTKDYMITRASGIGDLTFEHTEINHNQFFANGGGRDIGIVIAIKRDADYWAVRRLISRAVPIDVDVMVVIEVDLVEYAYTYCRIRDAAFGFSEEVPIVTLDLESIYTCLKLSNEVVISGLPFGLSARLPAVTHDYTPVVATLSLVSPLAQFYRIGVSSDYISINTRILQTNYGITDVPDGTVIIINSDEEEFSVILRYDPTLEPRLPDVNIETACDIGEFGFKFAPNEPMIVSTDKLPSSLSGERLTIYCVPRVSGV